MNSEISERPNEFKQRLKLFLPLLIFVILAIFFWRGLYIDPTHMPSALINKPVPVFHLKTVKDQQQWVSQNVLKDKVSLLNVWATWCVSCRVEHPFLLTLSKTGLPIYGINYKDDVEKARYWLQQYRDPYVLSVVDEDGRLGVDLGVYGAPETYLVDKQGFIRYKHVGVLSEKVWLEQIKPQVVALQNQ